MKRLLFVLILILVSVHVSFAQTRPSIPQIKYYFEGETGDITTKLQALVTSKCTPDTNTIIDFGGKAHTITTVSVPPGCQVTFQNGDFTIAGAGSMGFFRQTLTTAVLGGYPYIFDNMIFRRSVAGGGCVSMQIAWQDITGGPIVKSNCSFFLTNGAIGVHLRRGFYPKLDGYYTMDATSIAILANENYGAATDAPAGPIGTEIKGTFVGGTAFISEVDPLNPYNSFEGCVIGPDARLYVSKLHAIEYNNLRLIDLEAVSAFVELDGGFNTQIMGGYYDLIATTSQYVLKFTTKTRSHTAITIGGGVLFTTQGTPNNDLVVFSDEDTVLGGVIKSVVIGDSLFVGGGAASETTPIDGIKFSHAGLTSLNLTEGASFLALRAPLNFVKPIDRSYIGRFKARDVLRFAVNIATGYSGGYNFFPFLYKQYPIEIIVPTFESSGAQTVVDTQTIFFEPMMGPAIATLTNISPTRTGAFTMTLGDSSFDYTKINLIKESIATATLDAPGGASAILTLDATTYFAPY